MSFGKRLKEARKKKRMTQEQVGAILGIDHTSISKHENDHSEPDNETINKYANLYDVSINWIMNGKEGIMNDRKRKLIDDINSLNEKDQQYIVDLIQRLKKERP